MNKNDAWEKIFPKQQLLHILNDALFHNAMAVVKLTTYVLPSDTLLRVFYHLIVQIGNFCYPKHLSIIHQQISVQLII